MEQHEIEQLIKNTFSALTPKLQEAITGANVADSLRKIAEKHRLHIDQGQQLENETFLVMLGLDVVEHYQQNIKKSLRISEELADAITQDVQAGIFLSIRELLKHSTTPKEKTNTPPAGVVDHKNGTYTVDPYREPIE